MLILETGVLTWVLIKERPLWGEILVRVNGDADPTGPENTTIIHSTKRAQAVAVLYVF